tara:strand:- start:1291 stop:1458 length:168 start_codon:yes stop_codon:yes gene_type:complete
MRFFKDRGGDHGDGKGVSLAKLAVVPSAFTARTAALAGIDICTERGGAAAPEAAA